MAQNYEIVKGFETVGGIAKYDYESLENIPLLVKTINGEMPDQNGNIVIKTIEDEELVEVAEQIAIDTDFNISGFCRPSHGASSSGELFGDNDKYLRTNYINISNYNILRVTVRPATNSVSPCVFFREDNEESYISGITPAQDQLVKTEFEIEVPEDAVYAIFSSRIDTSFSYSVVGIRLVPAEEIETTQPVCYISPTGSDENSGKTSKDPILTLTRASKLLKSCGELIFMEGDYENLDYDLSSFSKVSTMGDVRLIYYSQKLSEATLVGGYQRVYSVPCSDTLSGYLWQLNIPDANTAILAEEYHPLQRKRQFRLEHTRIYPVTKFDTVSTDLAGYLATLESTTNKQMYYSDGTNCYFTAANSDFLTNPIIVPKSKTLKASEKRSVNISGLKIYFANILTTKLSGELNNLIVGYNKEKDAIRWDDTFNLVLNNCEVAATPRDGINGHYSGEITCYNCWGHDCQDDGESCHENCHIIQYGGLYEYNGNGCTPASGGTGEYINTIVRRSGGWDWAETISDSNPGSGFSAQGSDDSNIGAQMHCISCYAENCYIGFRKNSTGKSTYINCVSKNNTIAYGDGTQINCSDGTSNIPVIGENDNWYVGGKDTGVSAKGINGTTAYQAAQAGGYTKNESEFNRALANCIDWAAEGTPIAKDETTGVRDLNTYRTPGKYYANSDSIAKEVLNRPEGMNTNFCVWVFIRTTDSTDPNKNVASQLLLSRTEGLYIRSATTSGWNKWIKYTNSDEIEELTANIKQEIIEELTAGGEISGSIEVTGNPGDMILISEVDEEGKPSKWESIDLVQLGEEQEVILPEVTFFEGANNTLDYYVNLMGPHAIYFNSEPLIEGEKYIVTINNIAYIATAHLGKYSDYAPGVILSLPNAASIVYSEGGIYDNFESGSYTSVFYPDNDIPVDDELFWIYEPLTMEIQTNTGRTQIKQKYLPENFGAINITNAQPNQLIKIDEVNDGKPTSWSSFDLFGASEEEVVFPTTLLVDNVDIGVADEMEGLYIIYKSIPQYLKEGENYLVRVDDETYVVTAQAEQDNDEATQPTIVLRVPDVLEIRWNPENVYGLENCKFTCTTPEFVMLGQDWIPMNLGIFKVGNENQIKSEYINSRAIANELFTPKKETYLDELTYEVPIENSFVFPKNDTWPSLKTGTTYRIYYDGVIYTNIAKYVYSEICLGNMAINKYAQNILGPQTNTGEPFLVIYDTLNEQLWFLAEDEETHTISIEKMESEEIPSENIDISGIKNKLPFTLMTVTFDDGTKQNFKFYGEKVE